MKKKGWAKAVSMMPYRTNRELADKYDLCIRALNYKRKQLGIPVVTIWDRYKYLLGTIPDAELAKKMGMTPAAISSKRVREGIPPLNHSKEAALQEAFVKKLDSFKEYVRIDCGIIDILDDDYIYECKYVLNLLKAQRAIGQLFLYSKEYSDRQLAIVTTRIDLKKCVKERIKELGIRIITFDTREA